MTNIYCISVHLTNIYCISVYLTYVYIISVHLINVYGISVYLIKVRHIFEHLTYNTWSELIWKDLIFLQMIVGFSKESINLVNSYCFLDFFFCLNYPCLYGCLFYFKLAHWQTWVCIVEWTFCHAFLEFFSTSTPNTLSTTTLKFCNFTNLPHHHNHPSQQLPVRQRKEELQLIQVLMLLALELTEKRQDEWNQFPSKSSCRLFKPL